jgi:hypothetical protein
MKSGEIVESDPRTKVHVIWPHVGVRGGTNQERVQFNAATPADLSLGFIKRISEQTAKEARRGMDSAISDAMMEFFHSWTEDSREYVWQSVRGYIKLVYLAMEQGELIWTDAARIERIRAKAIERGDKLPKSAVASTSSSSRYGASQKAAAKPRTTRWCAAFQTGACTFTGKSHPTKYGPVSHICQFCFGNGKELNHAKYECNNSKGTGKSLN